MARVLHPSVVPTLFLLSAIATDSVPAAILDGVLDTALASMHEQHPVQGLGVWIERLKVLKPQQPAEQLAATLQDGVSQLLSGGIEMMHSWLEELKNLYPASDDDETPTTQPALHRNSPMAVYIRRARLTFAGTAFHDFVDWWDNLASWCKGTNPELPVDESELDRATALYWKGRATMDYVLQQDAMHRIDTIAEDPSEAAEDGCILIWKSLARAYMEYEHGSLETAHEILSETFPKARDSGQGHLINACGSLMLRISAASNYKFKPPVKHDLREDFLWEASQAVQSGEETLPQQFGKLYTHQQITDRVLDAASDTKASPRELTKMLAAMSTAKKDSRWHHVASLVWEELGWDPLTDLHQRLSMRYDGLPSDRQDIKFLNIARRSQLLVSRPWPGPLDALHMLFSAVETPERRKGLDVKALNIWKVAVLDVLDAIELKQGKRKSTRIPRPESLVLREDIHVAIPPTTSMRQALADVGLAQKRWCSADAIRNHLLIIALRLAITPEADEASRCEALIVTLWSEVLRLGKTDPALLRDAWYVRFRIKAVLAVAEAKAAGAAAGDRQAFVDKLPPEFLERCLLAAHSARDKEVTDHLVRLQQSIYSSSPSSDSLQMEDGGQDDVQVDRSSIVSLIHAVEACVVAASS